MLSIEKVWCLSKWFRLTESFVVRLPIRLLYLTLYAVDKISNEVCNKRCCDIFIPPFYVNTHHYTHIYLLIIKLHIHT